jgi:hypothetical protein
MLIINAVDEDCDSDASKVKKLRMQRGSEDPEKGLGGVAPIFERNPDNVASTLEWRGRALHSQEATQATTSSSRQQKTAKERWKASLDIEIGRTLQHYHAQELILRRAIANLEQMRESDLKQLEREKDGEDYYVPGWGEVQSDYQPTEYGDE